MTHSGTFIIRMDPQGWNVCLTGRLQLIWSGMAIALGPVEARFESRLFDINQNSLSCMVERLTPHAA